MVTAAHVMRELDGLCSIVDRTVTEAAKPTARLDTPVIVELGHITNDEIRKLEIQFYTSKNTKCFEVFCDSMASGVKCRVFMLVYKLNIHELSILLMSARYGKYFDAKLGTLPRVKFIFVTRGHRTVSQEDNSQQYEKSLEAGAEQKRLQGLLNV